MSRFLEKHEEIQARVNKLINAVADHVELSHSKIAQFAAELCSIYSEKDFRHSYWEISSVVEKLSPDQRDALCENLRELQRGAEEILDKRAEPKEEKNTIRQKIAKLCDHVDLESLRLARIDRVEYIGQEANSALTAADGKLKETGDKANALSNQVEGYHAQSISILGIFSGLVITFSGAIQFSASSLTNISEMNVYKISYFVCLTFLFLFNIIFMLMYSISKISGKSIATDCQKNNCSNCKQCKTIMGRLKKKYPYVFWFNLIGTIFVAVAFYIARR